MVSWRYTQELIYRNHGPLLIITAEQVASGSSVRTKRKPLVDCYRPVCAVDVTRPHRVRYVYDPWNSCHFVLKSDFSEQPQTFLVYNRIRKIYSGVSFPDGVFMVCLAPTCTSIWQPNICPSVLSSFSQTVSQREKWWSQKMILLETRTQEICYFRCRPFLPHSFLHNKIIGAVTTVGT